MKKKQISLEDEISARLGAFAHEIANLARVRTLEQLRGAFAQGIGAALDKSAAQALQSSPRKKPVRQTRAKRDPEALAFFMKRIVRHVEKRPGLSVEQIARVMQCTTGSLALPVRKAIAAGQITKKGERRATRYFPK